MVFKFEKLVHQFVFLRESMWSRDETSNFKAHSTRNTMDMCRLLSEHLVSMVLHHIGGQMFSMEPSTDLLVCSHE